ncbi:uncharacterized protein [Aristolochia californica]|uniref:uncharacterized protein isoform X2 n=1 Tax=Aristolochia californica TaxID=171875 RepID=UPI0035DCCED1
MLQRSDSRKMTVFKEMNNCYEEIMHDIMDENFDGEVVNEEKLSELKAIQCTDDYDPVVGGHLDDPFREHIEEFMDATSLNTSQICEDSPWTRSKGAWNPLSLKSLPKPRCSPQSIIDYCSQDRNQKMMGSLREHLLFEGWRIDSKEDVSGIQFRYVSPEGNIYYSLLKICREMKEKQEKINSDYGYEEIHRNSNLTSSSNSHAKRKSPKFMGNVLVEPEYCPQALIDLSAFEFMNGKVTRGESNIDLKSLRLKAKKHLSFEGWKFWNIRKGRSQELRYTAPNGKVYISLQMACKVWMEENNEISKAKAIRPSGCLAIQKKYKSSKSFSENSLSERFRRDEEFEKKLENRKSFSENSLSEIFRRDEEFEKKLENRKSSSITKVQKSPGGPTKYERTSRKQKAVAELSKSPVVLSSPKRKNPRTVLSWLMDNGVIFPMQQVSYINRRNGSVMAAGKVCKEGIRCSCCNKIFNLSAFEAHAGSSNHRPAANIYLSDGRSLLECQNEVKSAPECRRYKPGTSKMAKAENLLLEEDDICSICYHDGNLLLCDGCPAAFHLACVGLEDLPSGKWLCSSCQCALCGQGEFVGGTKEDIWCGQCEHKYHLGCLREQGQARDGRFPLENWFCSEECLKINASLSELLGKLNPTSLDDFSWTILRSRRENDDAIDASVVETKSEEHSKLLQAINVLHECFEPVIEPLTKSDLVTDVIFNRRSLLKRLNFKGFYTMCLQKGDELVTVATIRIFGGKVAEMPLVGTRFKYRRQGMCRLLVGELEKMLFSLGVERLFLPAAAQLVSTWTSSFGFSKLAHSERMKLLSYIFLEFQGTTMCQKLLTSETKRTASASEAMKRRESQENFEDQLVVEMDCDIQHPVLELMPLMLSGVPKILQAYKRRVRRKTD